MNKKGSPFLELSSLAGNNMPYGDIPSAGVVTGIGKVQGTYCIIVANDATVKGGIISIFTYTILKHTYD